jgi:hypothetical protein
MVVVLGLLIVTAVLSLSAVVVLFALASEAEVLPSLSRDEPVALADERRGVAGISSQPRSRVPLSN